jgi:hypothetical protein
MHFPSAQNYQFFAQEKKHSSLLLSRIMLKPNTTILFFYICPKVMLKTSDIQYRTYEENSIFYYREN